MIHKMIRASLRKNRLVSVFMASFLVLSSALLSGALILSLGVFGTVDSFMESAGTPHFMQMHLGTLDTDRLEQFAINHDDVQAFEVIEYLNIENSQLVFAGQSLDTEIQQNGFVTQPEKMDHLLSPEGEIIHPQAGEVYVPYFYESKYDLETGDEITVNTGENTIVLTVAGAFRDSQMNSTLASSKRLLISTHDYDVIASGQDVAPEYLISFRLNSASDASAFEATYFDAGLESNGPSLTWSLYRLINSINDVITVLLFIMMAIIILVIAFLCIRYSLMTTIEEDLHDVGVMKALGISNSKIGSIYLSKYRILLGSGVIIGLLVSLLARGAILANVRRSMGDVNYPILGILAGVLGALLLYGLSMLYVRRVLHRLRNISPLNAFQGQSELHPRRQRPKTLVPPTTGEQVNRKVAWANIRHSLSPHFTILIVACLITLTMLIPFRFGETARSADFVTYMGMGNYDIRIDLPASEASLEHADSIAAVLEIEDDVERLEIYTQEVEAATGSDGLTAPLRIDYGDHSTFPVRFSDGKAPETESEIAISAINSERFALGVGDTITIAGSDGPVALTISGIYQDITNGGKTAKALPGPTMDDDGPQMMIAVEAAEGADMDNIIATIHQETGAASVIDTGSYVQQMLGDIVRVMDTIAWVFAVVAIVLSALIAGLSIRLMRVQERKANAILGALGFTTSHLRKQYLLRIMTAMVIGVLIGVVLATPIGNVIGNAIFATVGVSGMALKFNLVATLLGSALVLLSGWIVTMLHTRPGFNADLTERLRA